MNELLITILLVVPSPHKLASWSVNQVPTQIQIIHKSGLEVSYTAIPVSCTTRPLNKKEMVFQSPQDNCYLVEDLSSPKFVRHKDFWFPVTKGDTSGKRF